MAPPVKESSNSASRSERTECKLCKVAGISLMVLSGLVLMYLIVSSLGWIDTTQVLKRERETDSRTTHPERSSNDSGRISNH